MSVVVIGVNQRSIPIGDFEKLAIDDSSLAKVLDDLTSSADISEAVVLSTCNRTEIYVRAEKFHPAFGDVRDALARHSGLATMSFVDHLYAHHDADAARHLFSVASGLDSAVLGETEILSQVRTAFDKAESAGVVGPALSRLFGASCTAGRKVRASTGIARNITSVSRAAVAMATHALGSLDGKAICVLGAGEMSEGMTVALRDAGTRRIVICNRTVERAQQLAERVGGDVAPLEQLGSVIEDVDVLLTGTGANELMISHSELDAIMTTRPKRRLLIVDIAVPRDVDPAAGEIPGVTLLDMEDLTEFAEAGREERRGEIDAVRAVIEDEVARFTAVSSAEQVEPLARAFRRDVESLRLAELRRVSASVDADTLAHVDAATKALLNKLLHGPMTELRESAGSARGDRLAEALQALFDIDPEG